MAIFSKILIPFDGSGPSKRAAEKGLAIAVDQQAEVVGLKVITFVGELITPSDRVWATIVEDLRGKARKILGELESMAQASGLKITLEVREGGAEEEMVALASKIGADLIVMGMGGRTGMGKYLGKSISRVLKEAPCPVMVVN